MAQKRNTFACGESILCMQQTQAATLSIIQLLLYFFFFFFTFAWDDILFYVVFSFAIHESVFVAGNSSVSDHKYHVKPNCGDNDSLLNTCQIINISVCDNLVIMWTATKYFGANKVKIKSLHYLLFNVLSNRHFVFHLKINVNYFCFAFIFRFSIVTVRTSTSIEHTPI